MNNLSPATPENSGPLARLDQSKEDYEQFLQQCAEKHLWSMLLDIQERLGTPAEQPADLEKVRLIAHRLSNLLTAIRLKNDLALVNSNPPRLFPEQCLVRGYQRRSECGD